MRTLLVGARQASRDHQPADGCRGPEPESGDSKSAESGWWIPIASTASRTDAMSAPGQKQPLKATKIKHSRSSQVTPARQWAFVHRSTHLQARSGLRRGASGPSQSQISSRGRAFGVRDHRRYAPYSGVLAALWARWRRMLLRSSTSCPRKRG